MEKASRESIRLPLPHSHTKNIEEITVQADIIITALCPNYFSKIWPVD
jgi:5,10-methylene-tetrahydrofolate dehydrogenase/methenyl tetrahydrofolate cyclohydrolase